MFKSILCSIAIVSCLTGTLALAATIDVTVGGTSGPWLYQPGGLNQLFIYGEGTILSPTIVDNSSGLSIVFGQQLTINYLSGLVTSAVKNLSQLPYVTAQGYTGYAANDNQGGDVFPSYFMPTSEYPIYITELVGTFADGDGNIVGTPFPVGLSATVPVPAGASQLQLGVNDNLLQDNGGDWQVEVSDSAVPEPGSLAGVVFLAAGSLVVRRRFTAS
jgi:hypothetical protein